MRLDNYAAAISIHLQKQDDFLPVLRQCVKEIERAEKRGIRLEYVGVRVDEEEAGQYMVYLKLDGPDRTVTGNLKGRDVLQILRVLFDRLFRAYAGQAELSHVAFV
ncbi:MAG: hypothetical protein IRZ01_03090 [Thermoflavifilum aggregans]|nr:hypothetical protein [Thermoflavifilum aggregans]